MNIQKAPYVSSEIVDISDQLPRRSFARAEANPLVVLVPSNQVDLHISPVPIAGDFRLEGKAREFFPAPLLVQFSDKALECESLSGRELLISRRHELIQRAKVPSGDWVGQNAQPGLEKVIGQVVASFAGFLRSEDG